MVFRALTVFPEFVESVFSYGILRKGIEAGVVSHEISDLRDYTSDKHRSTDDSPFGGGPGMVMLAEPVYKGVEAIREAAGEKLPLVYTSPAGRKLDHNLACEFAQGTQFIVLCGRYEGLDQRVIDDLVDVEVSLGDFVMSGGELAAMCIFDTVARQIPGVLGNQVSNVEESFVDNILDWPHYSRPEVFKNMSVPSVLLSGNHAKIASFREEQALLLTYRRRPDLLNEIQLEKVKQILADNRQES